MPQERGRIEHARLLQFPAHAAGDVADDFAVGLQLELAPHAGGQNDPSFFPDHFGMRARVGRQEIAVAFGKLAPKVFQIKAGVVARPVGGQHPAATVENSAADGGNAHSADRLVFEAVGEALGIDDLHKPEAG